MKTRRVRGGAFVRKGSYGCAFKNPPLKCKSEPRRRSNRELSKLLNDYKADKEYAESVPFQRIDPDKHYFLWAHHKCELNTANVKPDNRLNKCVEPMAAPDGSSYSVVNMRRPHPTLIFYELGGQDVSDIVLSSGQYGPFFASFLNLLKGLEVLHANHYAHLDIKPLNIVSMELPTGEFATRFIDFGLSMSTERVSGRERSLQELSQFDYPYYPFDFRFVSPTHVRSASQQEINKWYAMMVGFKNYLPQDEYYDASWRPRFDAANFSKLPQLIDFSKVEEILQEVDVYGLGVSFGELYSRLTRHVMRGYPKRIKVVIGDNTYDVSSLTGRHFGGNEALATWHKQIAQHISMPLYELIGFMIDAVPTRRVSAFEARTLFEKEVLPNIVRYFGSPNTYAALSSVGVRLTQSAPARYTIPAAAPGPAVVAPRVEVPPPAYVPPPPPPLPVVKPARAPVNIQKLIAEAQQVLGKTSDPKGVKLNRSGTSGVSNPSVAKGSTRRRKN
jgi:serine/threonine protein kinase